MTAHERSIDAVLRQHAWRSTAAWVRYQQHTFKNGIFARYETGAGGLMAWHFNRGLNNGTRELIRDAGHAEQLLHETGVLPAPDSSLSNPDSP